MAPRDLAGFRSLLITSLQWLLKVFFISHMKKQLVSLQNSEKKVCVLLKFYGNHALHKVGFRKNIMDFLSI